VAARTPITASTMGDGNSTPTPVAVGDPDRQPGGHDGCRSFDGQTVRCRASRALHSNGSAAAPGSGNTAANRDLQGRGERPWDGTLSSGRPTYTTRRCAVATHMTITAVLWRTTSFKTNTSSGAEPDGKASREARRCFIVIVRCRQAVTFTGERQRGGPGSGTPRAPEIQFPKTKRR